MDLGLQGKVALVAGGGRGIGRAIAIALAGEGARVAVVARTASELDATAAAAAGALPFPADLSDAAATEEALARVTGALGPPEILVVAAAAFYPHRKLHNITPDDTRTLLDLDLGAAVRLCRLVLPGMMAARHGRVVFLGSLAAATGQPGAPLYGAAKAALEGLARSLAVDYSRHGITANTVRLGFVETERLAARTAADPEAHARLVRATARRKLLDPGEVADAVTFLCSARAAGITGAVLEVTAGAHLGNNL